MLLILLLILIAVLSVGIAYLVWIVRTIMKKRFRLLAGLILIPAILFIGLMTGMHFYGQQQYREYLSGLFSVAPTDLGSAIFQYDSPRAFTGDGYSISVYSLPPSIETRFSVADETLVNFFPVRPGYRNHWKTVFWQKTPLLPEFEKYADFALSEYVQDSPAKLQEHFDNIRKALSTSGNYFAFFYNDPGSYIGDIDFFLIDLRNKRLYIINLNT